MAGKGSDTTEPIIFLDDISVTFRTRTGSLFRPNTVNAVRGVTIRLMPGETVGIVGESGCGKSTTANVMCGLQSPTSGRVYFKGQDVTRRSAEMRKQIGRVVSVVFQDPATRCWSMRSIPPWTRRGALASSSSSSVFPRAPCAPSPASSRAASASVSPSRAPCR